MYADAAYCGDAEHGSAQPIANWSCEPCNVSAVVHLLGIASSAERQTLAFVAVESMSGRTNIVASFRGSVLPVNFADDQDQVLTPWLLAQGQVHRGLHRSFASLEPAFTTHLQRAMLAYPGAPIFVTGHSMGAAQAVYAATAIAHNHSNVNVTIIGFGTPRPGDAAFAAYVGSLPNLNSWAITHRADIVPQCGIFPAPCDDAALGFQQIHTNIWFAEDMVTPPLLPLAFRMCDGSGEDPTCEDAVDALALNWQDHNFYLQHSMWCCAAGKPSGVDGCAFPFPDSSRSPLARPVAARSSDLFPAPFSRPLALSDPPTAGRDVTILQHLLSRAPDGCALAKVTGLYDSATAVSLACFAGTAVLDMPAAHLVLSGLSSDGYQDDGTPASALGYKYTIVLPVHRNRSVETHATLLDAHNTVLHRFIARTHGLDVDAAGRPINERPWPDYSDAGCPQDAAT